VKSHPRLYWLMLIARTSHLFQSPPFLAQEIEGIVCLGGTSTAYTVAKAVDDGDESFVIESAVDTACRCSTPHQPLIQRNQLSSCAFVHFFLECQNSGGFLGMAKRHQALV